MAGPISVQCPQCGAKLKLKSPKAVGKKVGCPKCQRPFVVEPQPKPDDELAGLDEFDSFEDESYADDNEMVGLGGAALPPAVGAKAPSQSSAKKSQRKKKRTKSSRSASWKLPAIIAGGACVAILLVGVLIWALVGSSSNGPIGGILGDGAPRHKLDLAYLPPDADSITVNYYADMWSTSQVQAALEKDQGGSIQADIDKWNQEFGIAPGDIESVTTATSGMFDLGRRIRAAPGNLQQLRDSIKSVTVVRCSKAFDQQKILAKAGSSESAEHEGQTYHRFANGRAAFFPDPTTLVLGNERDVQASIDQGSAVPPRPELDFVDGAAHSLTVMAPQDPSYFDGNGGLLPTIAASAVDADRENVKGKVRAICTYTVLGDGSSSRMVVNCTDAEGAAAIAEQAEAALEQQREAFKQSRDGAPNNPLLTNLTPEQQQQMAKIRDVSQQMMDSMSVSRDGNTVVTTFHMPTVDLDDNSPTRGLPIQINMLLKSRGMLLGFSGAMALPTAGGAMGSPPTVEPSVLESGGRTPTAPMIDRNDVLEKFKTLGYKGQVGPSVGEEGVTALTLSGPQMTDQAAAYVGGLTELRGWLDLQQTGITDDQVARFAGLTKLRRLQLLEEPAVTDKALAHLAPLTNLRHLSLTTTSVTGSGFQHLANLTQLETITLIKSPVTDDVVPHLEAMPNLNELNLYGTNVSKRGIATLKAALPNCRITAPQD